MVKLAVHLMLWIAFVRMGRAYASGLPPGDDAIQKQPSLMWLLQTSHTKSSLRAIAAVSAQIVWASGTNGTYLVTTDGGAHWRSAVVPGAESLDFRAVVAFNGTNAFLMSSGDGDRSRLYSTRDGGVRWRLLFTNPDPKGFFDALAFWDRRQGMILGDPVKGQFAVFTTNDGGEIWSRRTTPRALADEGAFAASNTSLALHGTKEAWFGTGGIGAARVFRTKDGGESWIVSSTPMRNDSKTAGIFSLAFSDTLHGIAVGGDYEKPQEGQSAITITKDGGKTWTIPRAGRVAGFRSAVIFMPGSRDTMIAVGTAGSDVSTDGGESWHTFSLEALNSVGIAEGSVWAVGPQGTIAKLRPVESRPNSEFSDSEGDGTPDFLRLENAFDQMTFRRWFSFLAEVQYFIPKAEMAPEIGDCAALVRYAYREALRRHDENWSAAAHLPLMPAIDSIGKYSYPHTPLGAALFRLRSGPFTRSDLRDGTFSQFASAETLQRFNTFFVSRDVRLALPGDLLFYRRETQHMPYHAMIFIGKSQVAPDPFVYVVYHTGPDGAQSGEVRRLSLDRLLRYPDPEWQPISTNPSFLGVFRWNILRMTP